MTRCLRLLLVVVAAAACRSAAPTPASPAAPSPAAAPAVTAVAAPAAIRVPEAIRWVQHSAEHRAIFLQVYHEATQSVERVAGALPRDSWAVVLDADETVIDNSAYEVEQVDRHLPFDAKSWHAWTARREAVALPGAAGFLSRVHALGGKIAIVTNRSEGECPDTEALFRTQNLPFDIMLCKPDAGSGDKNPRFEAVARGTTPAGLPPLHIVAFLGDNIFDFPGMSQAVVKEGDHAFAEFGVHFFILPNPMYGSWQ